MLHNYLENAHKFIFCYLLFCFLFLFSFHTPPHVSVCVCAYICIHMYNTYADIHAQEEETGARQG